MTTLNSGNIISVNDFDMYFEIHGRGSPLLLLHGFTGSGEGLASLFNQLSSTYQLIIPDLRGHGRSTNPSKQFTFHQAALDVFALLQHLGIEQCSAVGFSGGGCTLLQMAYLHPERIKSMALVSAASYFPKKTREIMQQIVIENKTNEEWAVMRQIHVHGDQKGFKDIVEMLIEKNAEINKPNLKGFTPIFVACQKRYKDIIELLIKKGVEINIS